MPALLLSAGIGWGFNSRWLYTSGFQKYGVSQTTGLAPAELEKAAAGLISYFNSTDEYVNITLTKDGKPFPLLTREEAIHFKDVKDLVWLDYRVFFISLVYALAFALVCLFRRRRKYLRVLARSALWGSGLTLGLMLLLGIGVVLDFDRLFLQFHFLAFTNTFWSAPGYMLLLFPGGFWYDATAICAGFTGLLAILVLAVSYVYLKHSEKAPE